MTRSYSVLHEMSTSVIRKMIGFIFLYPVFLSFPQNICRYAGKGPSSAVFNFRGIAILSEYKVKINDSWLVRNAE